MQISETGGRAYSAAPTGVATRWLFFRHLPILLLPLSWAIGGRNLDRRHHAFRTVGRPIRNVGGDDIALAQSVVKCRLDDTPRYASVIFA